MVKLVGILSHFRPVSVLVVGDFMLDTYTTGRVKRISPEAPVSVLHVQNEESRPGGAGNVALNLTTLGAHVLTLGRIGADIAGEQLKSSLQEEGVDTTGLLLQPGFQTPVKNRLIADSQQILRVDIEASCPNSSDLEDKILDIFQKQLPTIDVIAISDYGKGFLSRLLLQRIIEMARAEGVLVIVDPKGPDFSRYLGATVIKPNLSEAYLAAQRSSEAPLHEVAELLLRVCDVDELLITRSEAGISLFRRGGERADFPVRSKEVKDVTGAGDTVLAMISLALANGLDIKKAAQLANIAAGLAIERIGCARIHLSEIAERLLEYDVDNKIFDEEHLFALQQALKGKHYTVLGIESSRGMTTPLFRSIRRLASRDLDKKLIVYVRNPSPDEEFILLLSSLAEVDFIVLKCESLRSLCEVIQPHEAFLIKGDDLILLETSSAIFSV